MTKANPDPGGGGGDAPVASGETSNPFQHVPERSADTKPLAAYRLGLKSREFWTHHQFLCENPCGALAEAVALALAQLRADRATLAEDTSPHVSEEMGHALDKLDRLTASFTQELLAELDPDVLDRHARRPPGQDFWVRWTGLADRALAEGYVLRGLYDFGAALGAVLVALSERSPRNYSTRDEADLYSRWVAAGVEAPLPDIGTLVRRARALPDELVWQVPHLMTLRQLGSEIEGPGRGAVMAKLLVVHPDLCPFSDGGSYLSPGVVRRTVYGLDERVQEGLAKVDLGLKCSLPLHDKRLLHWDEDAGELRYAHIVLRKLATQASTARRLLARFQEKGWDECVPSPFNQLDEEKLKGALRTLKDVKMIKFHESEPYGVSYTWVDGD